MVHTSIGILSAYATIALPQLGLNENQGSWFASLDMFALMLFAPIGGILSGKFGRRLTMLMFAPFIAFGWILIGASNSNFMLFSGRILSSIAISLSMSSPSMYDFCPN